MEKNLYFTSLGCSKNLVDAQVMLGYMGLDGYQVVGEPQDAQVIVVNTCSFVESAKVESIETILDMADYKAAGTCKALVVSGCLAQRYASDLETEMPEVDLFIGTGEYNKITYLLKALAEGKLDKKSFVEIPKYIHTEFDPRINTSPSYMAWLKISEGCNRNCTFCIIPTLRGKLRSRSVDSLVVEAKNLISQGVKELNLISQDLSDYGVDLDEKNNLYQLLKSLSAIDNAQWVRLFYFYPDDLTEEVMELISISPNICKYLDMPVQHFSDQVLKRMNRKVTGKKIIEKIERLRDYIPSIVLRTSVIVGFPGETQEDFETLLQGIEQMKFDHLGVFKYSDEEGTPAFNLPNKLSQDVIDERFNQVYEIQSQIAAEKNKTYLGKKLQVLVEGPHEDTDMLIKARHAGQAPDIDGCVIINDGTAHAGDFVMVEVTDVIGFDLVAKIIK